MGLGKGVKSRYRGGMGHRLINDACLVSHQDFFQCCKSILALYDSMYTKPRGHERSVIERKTYLCSSREVNGQKEEKP